MTAAIEVLDQSWRAGKQTKVCLRAQFKLLLTVGDDEPIHQLIHDYGGSPHSDLPEIEKARLVVELKRDFLDKQFHRELDELVLTLASENLAHNHASKSGHELLNQLKFMREEDQLLTRDTTRFIAKNQKVKPQSMDDRTGHLNPTFDVGIPQEGRWQSLANLDGATSIAGVGANTLVVAQLNGRSCMGSELKADEFDALCRQVYHLGLIGNPNKARVFYFPSFKRIHFRSLNTSRTATHDALGGLQDILAIGPIDHDSFMVLQYYQTSSLIAHEYDPSGVKVNSIVLDLMPPDMAEVRWFCAKRDRHSCFSAGTFAAWRYPDGEIAACHLNEPIHKLVFSPDSHRVRALISSEQEVALLTPQKAGKVPEFVNLYVSDGGHPCQATFAKNGDIIVISGNRGEILSATNHASASATFSFPSALGHAVDISPRGARGFIILTSSGRLVVFD